MNQFHVIEQSKKENLEKILNHRMSINLIGEDLQGTLFQMNLFVSLTGSIKHCLTYF